MNPATIWHLVKKDWHLNRVAAVLTVAGSVLAICLLLVPGKTATSLGANLGIGVLIALTFHLPLSSVLEEKHGKTLIFLMSLPVSKAEYVASKILSNLSLFMLPWVTVVAGLRLISARTEFPLAGNGFVPVVLIGMVLGFAFVLAFALITESGGWTVALIVSMLFFFGNVFNHLVPKIPDVSHILASIASRGTAFVVVIAVEVFLIAALLGATFVRQSRKKDFI